MHDDGSARAEFDGKSDKAFLLTWMRTIVYVDNNGRLRHAYYPEIRAGCLNAIILPALDVPAPSTRYAPMPERREIWEQAIAAEIGAQGLPMASVSHFSNGFVHLRSPNGDYFCAEPNGSMVQNRPNAQQWEAFSVCAWGRAADADDAARERLVVEASVLHHAGRSQHAIRALDQMTAEGWARPAEEPALRVAQLRAEIDIDLGRWHRFERMAGPRWDYFGASGIQGLARFRAALDGMSPMPGRAGGVVNDAGDTRQASYQIGVATLDQAPSPERQGRVRRASASRVKVSRVVTMPRLEWPYHCGAVVTSARVVGHDFVCYAPGIGALPFSNHHHHWYRREGSSKDKHIFAILRPNERLRELTVLIGGHMNYYHNTVEYLLNYYFVVKMEGLWRTFNPRFADLLSEAKLLVRASKASFHQEYLDILGVPVERTHRIADHQAIECDNLMLLPKAIQGDGYVRDIDAVGWLHDRIDRRSRAGSGPRHVYVSRSDAGRRRVVNEDEVCLLLRQYGFVTILPSTLSVLDQFRLFRDASVVVGPHGAGLTNILATRPGCKVIELVPSKRQRLLYFRNLAGGLGHDHTFIEAQTTSETLDMKVDIPKLRAALDEMQVGWNPPADTAQETPAWYERWTSG